MEYEGQHFPGEDYIHERDSARLGANIKRVYEVLADHDWHTIPEIAEKSQTPQLSVGSQIRNLRLKRFGWHIIEKKSNGKGLYSYRMMGHKQ